LAGRAGFAHFQPGEVVFDAFSAPQREVLLVLDGRVDLWTRLGPVDQRPVGRPDEERVTGGTIGFSSVLSQRPVGPLAVAATPVRVAAFPASAVTAAFAPLGGARYLVERVPTIGRQIPRLTAYSAVDDLIVTEPLVVPADEPLAGVAAAMAARDLPYAAVRLPSGGFGMLTDAMLRRSLTAAGALPAVPVDQVADLEPPTVARDESSAQALLLLLDRNADFVLVVDGTDRLCGVVAPRDFMVSATTAGVSLHEQIRRADTGDELCQRSRRLPALVGDLVARGLDAGVIIQVHSAVIDTIIRRAIDLVFDRHPDLSTDAFTWLSLGSNGRHEAVLSSDIDCAVAFDDAVDPALADAYRAVFAEVNDLLDGAGLRRDRHGTNPQNPRFARTNRDWRAAALDWMAAPEKDDGAIMTSLMVDGRPIHGDPGLSEVNRVFGDLRRHPGTKRLLLQEMLSRRAQPHPLRDALRLRSGPFDIKAHGVLPIVNIGRWAALNAGSTALPTVDRLRSGAGSEMVPADRAETLIESFRVLQRLRLHHQLRQLREGTEPSDRLDLDSMSAIDRSVLAQAVREVGAAQRRMDRIAQYVPIDEW
jgi:CBS domain-containing protein